MRCRLAQRQLRRHQARCGRWLRAVEPCPPGFALVAFAYHREDGTLAHPLEVARGRRTDSKPYEWYERGGRSKRLSGNLTRHAWPLDEARAFARHLLGLPVTQDATGDSLRLRAALLVGPRARRVTVGHASRSGS